MTTKAERGPLRHTDTGGGPAWQYEPCFCAVIAETAAEGELIYCEPRVTVDAAGRIDHVPPDITELRQELLVRRLALEPAAPFYYWVVRAPIWRPVTARQLPRARGR